MSVSARWPMATATTDSTPSPKDSLTAPSFTAIRHVIVGGALSLARSGRSVALGCRRSGMWGWSPQERGHDVVPRRLGRAGWSYRCRGASRTVIMGHDDE